MQQWNIRVETLQTPLERPLKAETDEAAKEMQMPSDHACSMDRSHENEAQQEADEGNRSKR
eukprot:6805341-Karenia_brevis.AAC.1